MNSTNAANLVNILALEYFGVVAYISLQQRIISLTPRVKASKVCSRV
ncbi:unnamed protein product, partial [Vitis vinifera]|uniref:Uncharacterized protein n=1 Tax=Vitis vinifera TaxID=29760 RepID=D7T583_VITVI